MNFIKPLNEKTINPGISLLILGVLFIIFLGIGQFIGIGIIKIAFNLDLGELQILTTNPEQIENGRMALLYLHALGTILISFIATTYFWNKIIEKRDFNFFFQAEHSNYMLFLLAILVTFISNPLNSVFISLNKQMTLPAGFENLEKILKEKEAFLEQLTKFLVDFQSPLEIIVAVLVMGILTGMGEELLFRGAVQRKFMDWFGNHHAAIWIAAAIFSFVHMQFYGFIPRMLLAALFGYLYYWSGNLWIPIIAHASNNTITVLAMHFTKDMKEAQAMVESNEMMPLPYVFVSLFLTGGILYYFYTQTKNLQSQKS